MRTGVRSYLKSLMVNCMLGYIYCAQKNILYTRMASLTLRNMLTVPNLARKTGLLFTLI